MLAMKRSRPELTRRGAMQALLGVAWGAAGGLSDDARAKSRVTPPPTGTKPAPWLTLPPTPALPPPGKSGIAEVNGTRLFYAQFGQGTPVLMLHGGMGSSNYWGYQIEALAKDHLVTVVDTRGHGRSPVTSSAFSYEIFADDVIALIAFLKLPPAAIVGWSDGAITGLILAMRKPELVARLFAFGANASLDGMKAGGGRTPVFAAYSARCKAEYRELSPDPDKWSKLVDGLRAVWHSELHITRRKLGAIERPTTISLGQYDEIIRPEHAREMAGAIPGARLAIQPDVSHFAMLQNPQQFNAALAEFLAA
jgi:pimeloyl-ACP methyl ester carboxylesterase